MSKRSGKIPISRIALASVGVLFISLAGCRGWEAAQSYRWNQVDGTVIESRREPIRVSTNHGNEITEGYRNIVGYGYQWADKSYHSYTIGSGPGALEATQKLKTGESVKVYVNPANASESLLFPGLSSSAIFSMCFCLAVGCVPLALALFAGRGPQKNRSKSVDSSSTQDGTSI
jgi:hypothetical protein